MLKSTPQQTQDNCSDLIDRILIKGIECTTSCVRAKAQHCGRAQVHTGVEPFLLHYLLTNPVHHLTSMQKIG
jgi:hypothetical protein